MEAIAPSPSNGIIATLPTLNDPEKTLYGKISPLHRHRLMGAIDRYVRLVHKTTLDTCQELLSTIGNLVEKDPEEPHFACERSRVLVKGTRTLVHKFEQNLRLIEPSISAEDVKAVVHLAIKEHFKMRGTEFCEPVDETDEVG